MLGETFVWSVREHLLRADGVLSARGRSTELGNSIRQIHGAPASHGARPSGRLVRSGCGERTTGEGAQSKTLAGRTPKLRLRSDGRAGMRSEEVACKATAP